MLNFLEAEREEEDKVAGFGKFRLGRVKRGGLFIYDV